MRAVGSRAHGCKIGKVVKHTREFTEIQLGEGCTIRVKKKNVEAMIQQDSAKSCVGAGALKFASGE